MISISRTGFRNFYSGQSLWSVDLLAYSYMYVRYIAAVPMHILLIIGKIRLIKRLTEQRYLENR